MARSADKGFVLKLLIVGLVEAASGALVHIAATAIEDVVRLGHTLCLFSVSAGRCRFWYRPLCNLGAFIRPRIGLTAFFNWSEFSFGKPQLCVVATPKFARGPLKTKSEFEAYRGPASSLNSQFHAELLQREWVRIHPGQRWRSSTCGGAGSGKVPEHYICRVLRDNLRLTCVKM